VRTDAKMATTTIKVMVEVDDGAARIKIEPTTRAR